MSASELGSGSIQDLKIRAALLKSEGNALFMARKWIEAQSKFIEALELDKENAILYANRAACCLQLGKSVSIATDETQLRLL